MSTQSRPMRPPGAVVSDKGNQLAPLPASFEIEPPSGDTYVPVEVLGLPRPLHTSVANANVAQNHSILIGDPYAPHFLSTGDRLTVANYRLLAQNRSSPPSKRPRNQIKNNKSTYIARGLVFETFGKRMKPDTPLECLVLTNFDRTLVLVDFSAPGSCGEPLAKLFFTKAWPVCHSLNYATASAQQLDVVVGMSTGDLLWIDLVSQRYERLNKVGNLTHSPVTAVEWLPGSESLVAVAHADGLVVIYDVYGEDNSDPMPLQPPHALGSAPAANKPDFDKQSNENGAGYVVLSLNSSSSKSKRTGTAKAAYRLSNSNQRITALKFISQKTLVVAAHNDYLKIFDLEAERTVEVWPSLFGSILALAMSPDSRYLCCGGEDDLISVFDLQTTQMVARLAGHKAWVKSIAFDPFGCDETSYRLASVGEDQQVIVWDFTPTTLTQPKWRPQVEIESGLKFTSSTHAYKESNLVVRGRVLQYSASTLFFAAKTRPHFDEYGESPLSDVAFSRELLLVASSDGRIWSWKKQPSQTAIRKSLGTV